MEIKSNTVRPIGYCTIEFNEAELQTIVGTFEELQVIKNQAFENIKGLRGDIYKKLVEVLAVGKQ